MVDVSLEKESKKAKIKEIRQLEREIKYHKKNKNKIIFKNTIKGGFNLVTYCSSYSCIRWLLCFE